MILHYFIKNGTTDKKTAELIYQKIINNVNSIILCNSKVLKKDINTTFEITSIFIISIFFGSKFKKNKDDFLILQEIIDQHRMLQLPHTHQLLLILYRRAYLA